MFFFLPYGHDQPVYDRPWITIGLIALCTLIFAGTCAVDLDADADLDAALTRVDAIHEEHPDARIRFEVTGLPREQAAVVATFTDTGPRDRQIGDAELEDAMLDVVAALNRIPAFRFGYRPGSPSPATMITHMFVHADIFHLFGNMLLLWLAGGVLECFWRRWAFVLLYFVGGLCGALTHHLFNIGSQAPMIGASGAIAGLLGAFVVGYPQTQIKIWYLVWVMRFHTGTWQVKAWFIIPLWVALELLHALTDSSGGVAYWAHVGGFAVGAVGALLAKKLNWVAVDAGTERIMPEPVRVAFGVTPTRPISDRPPRLARQVADVAPIPLPGADPDDPDAV